MKFSLLATVSAVAACFALLLAPHPALSQTASRERIDAYTVGIDIATDGTILVREEIAYDFGASGHHGIDRDVVTRQRYDDTSDRSYPIEVASVTASPAGTPSQYKVENLDGGITRIRVGDPNNGTLTGAHTYVITYRLRGTLNAFADHDELYWNVIGDQWAVGIARAAVTVHAPAAPTQVACFAGPTNSKQSCTSAAITGGNAVFAQTRALGAYEGMSIVVGLPKGAVAAPAPILIERWSFARAFTADTPRLVLMAVAMLAVIAGVWRLVWMVGRDREWRGQPVAAIPASADDVEIPVPLMNETAYPVEYTPPEGMRPGLVGTLFDEVAHPLDVSASIIDLATRGFLKIEEIEGKGFFASDDWKLTKVKPGEGLSEYETLLFDGLFQDGDEVLFSDLKLHFYAREQNVEGALYAELVSRGWYRRSPQSTRAMWSGLAVAALVGAIGLEVAAAVFTSFAIVPLPLILGALALLMLHNRMPARTANGTAAYRRVRGFRRFIVDAETNRARFAEDAGLFYEYLPYAIVFGATKQWAKKFEGLALSPPDWYVSSTPFNAFVFASAMGSFSDRGVSVMTSTPGSSGGSGFGGGGFSGGGGGGGGGGSW